MKRCILVGTRVGKDKETGDELLFLTMCKLPSRMSKGGLWVPSQSELVVNACINKSRKPEDFKRFASVLPGTLLDVTFGVNDFNGKTFVAAVDVVPDTTLLTEEQLYV